MKWQSRGDFVFTLEKSLNFVDTLLYFKGILDIQLAKNLLVPLLKICSLFLAETFPVLFSNFCGLFFKICPFLELQVGRSFIDFAKCLVLFPNEKTHPWLSAISNACRRYLNN